MNDGVAPHSREASDKDSMEGISHCDVIWGNLWIMLTSPEKVAASTSCWVGWNALMWEMTFVS